MANGTKQSEAAKRGAVVFGLEDGVVVYVRPVRRGGERTFSAVAFQGDKVVAWANGCAAQGSALDSVKRQVAHFAAKAVRS